MEDKTIIIAGIEITREKFPHLYRIAEKSPEMLDRQLRYFTQTDNPTETDIWSAAINFENDLAHG